MKKIIDVADLIKDPSALSQEQGDIVNAVIVASFKEKEKVSLDFSHVESMFSPFLNNAIGKLYENYTTEFITQYLELVNFPKNKVSTLNIVISNAKKFYANPKIFVETLKDVLSIE